MIYDQLLRVNEIDHEISLLHQQLGELYQERKAIVTPPVEDKPTKPSGRLQWKRRATARKQEKTNA